uniref:Uncharacterized protein n=1 Tax=Globodera rostochiensis TaxID=31243 RepID=A0A914IEL4_GLORO
MFNYSRSFLLIFPLALVVILFALSSNEVQGQCYFMNCSTGFKVRTEWGCLSDEQTGKKCRLANEEAAYFENDGFKCRCRIGENGILMSNEKDTGFPIPVTTTTLVPPSTEKTTTVTTTTTTTTTVRTTTTTTVPKHVCKQKMESAENSTVFGDQCPAEENFCYFLNCTSGTSPNKTLIEWGCMQNLTSEICVQKLGKLGFSLDKDSCYCHVGRENQNITFLQKKMTLSDFQPAFSFAHRNISHFKAVVIAILLVSFASAIAHAMLAGV